MTNKTSLFLFLAIATILITSPLVSGSVFADKNEDKNKEHKDNKKDKNDNNPFQTLYDAIATLQGLIDGLTATIAALQDQVNADDDAIKTLQDENTSLHDVIADLEARIVTLEKGGNALLIVNKDGKGFTDGDALPANPTYLITITNNQDVSSTGIIVDDYPSSLIPTADMSPECTSDEFSLTITCSYGLHPHSSVVYWITFTSDGKKVPIPEVTNTVTVTEKSLSRLTATDSITNTIGLRPLP